MSRIVYDGATIPARFIETDDGDTTRKRVTAEAELADLTPLAGLELIEQLHAARNTLRRNAGLPEIAQADAMLVLLAFLRRIAGEPVLAENLPEEFTETWREIAERRRENGASAGRAPGPAAGVNDDSGQL